LWKRSEKRKDNGVRNRAVDCRGEGGKKKKKKKKKENEKNKKQKKTKNKKINDSIKR